MYGRIAKIIAVAERLLHHGDRHAKPAIRFLDS